MFEECTTFAELNKERARLITSGEHSVTDVNNEYNKRRLEIGTVKSIQKSVLKKYIPVTQEFPRVCTIPIIHGNDTNLIQLTAEGFVL